MGCVSSSDNDAVAARKREQRRKNAATLKLDKSRSKELWLELRKRLPGGEDLQSQVDRDELFKKFDVKKQGSFDVKTAQLVAVHVLKLNELTDNVNPIVANAFDAAKQHNRQTGKTANEKAVYDQLVDRSEFLPFLKYIRDYFELWVMFDDVDSSDDGAIGYKEYLNALGLLEEWGVKVNDPKKEFRRMDVDGSHTLFFEEFADFAIRRKLDFDGDDDDAAPNPLTHNRNNSALAAMRANGKKNSFRPFSVKPYTMLLIAFGVTPLAQSKSKADYSINDDLDELAPPELPHKELLKRLIDENKEEFQFCDRCDNERLHKGELMYGLTERYQVLTLLPKGCSHDAVLNLLCDRGVIVAHTAMASANPTFANQVVTGGDMQLDYFGFVYFLNFVIDFFELMTVFDTRLPLLPPEKATQYIVIDEDEANEGAEVLSGWLNCPVKPTNCGNAVDAEETAASVVEVTNKNAAPVAVVRPAFLSEVFDKEGVKDQNGVRIVPLPAFLHWCTTHKRISNTTDLQYKPHDYLGVKRHEVAIGGVKTME